MKTLILCEGKTDAILISYLLCKISRWNPTKADKKMSVAVSEKNNESAYWYERENDKLLICGVGGKDKFTKFFSEKIYDLIYSYPQSETFKKVIVIQDKDNESVVNVENNIKNCLQPIAQEIKNNEWVTNAYRDSFGKEEQIDLLGLVIPFESEGALESVMLNSLKENQPERYIVEHAEAFIDEVKESAKAYINKPRLELKAKLGVTFAVLSPMKVFTYINELIKTVDWEKYSQIRDIFGKVLEL